MYGYFALLFVTPILQKLIPSLPGFNLLSAGIVMGIMIVPYVASISEDAMRAVPMSLREGSFAMGATRLQTAIRVVVPAAISGLAAAYILGVSRAVGETMILAVAAGMQPNLTFNPLESASTITAFIVQVALGDLPHGSIGYQTIFARAHAELLTLTFNSSILDAKALPQCLLPGRARPVADRHSRADQAREAARRHLRALASWRGTASRLPGPFLDMLTMDGRGCAPSFYPVSVRRAPSRPAFFPRGWERRL